MEIHVHVRTLIMIKFCYLFSFFIAGDEDVSSGLSEHSSDVLQPPTSMPHQPTHQPSHQLSRPLPSKETESELTEDAGSDLLTPSASDSKLTDGKPITSQQTDDATLSATKKQVQKKVNVYSAELSIKQLN